MVRALVRKAESDPDGFNRFSANFGAILKEGLIREPEQREELLKLARFETATANTPIGLSEYTEQMQAGQESIYYLAGDEPETLRVRPQLEGFVARELPVLLFTDPVDELWVARVGAFAGHPFKSVTQGAVDFDVLSSAGEPPSDEPDSFLAGLLDYLKRELGDQVIDVRTSDRLKDSAACLVASEGDPDLHLARMLREHGGPAPRPKRILEINSAHPLVARMAAVVEREADDGLADSAWILLDHARIAEGESVPDPALFSRRLSRALERSLAHE